MLKFLIVDDSPSDRLFMRKLATAFPSPQVEILEVDTAYAGLQLCREQNIDLILLDYQLPDITGIKFLEELQTIESEVLPAVIIVTSEISSELDDRCLNNGAANFLTKGNISTCSFLRAVKYALKGKEREQELNQVRKEYEEASKSKDKFLSYLSHEFRTPLTSIISTGELLANRQLLKDPNLEELGQLINENGRQVLNLVDDLIKLSSLSEKNIFLEYETITTKEISTIILEKLQKQHSTSINFKVNISSQTPEDFTCDPYCLKQILRFLIENAYRNTFSGEITVTISTPSKNLIKSLKLSEFNKYLTFTVHDTGIGYCEKTLKSLRASISSEQLPSLQNFNGNGISLNLASSLAKELNGRISIESELGRGSKISLTIPQSTTTKSEENCDKHSFAPPKTEESIQLKQILIEQAKPLLNEVKESMSINEINDFLCKMKSLTVNYTDKKLFLWCQELESLLSEYELDKITQQLAKFEVPILEQDVATGKYPLSCHIYD